MGLSPNGLTLGEKGLIVYTRIAIKIINKMKMTPNPMTFLNVSLLELIFLFFSSPISHV